VVEVKNTGMKDWVKLGILFIFGGVLFLLGIAVERYKQTKNGLVVYPTQASQPTGKPDAIFTCNQDADCQEVIDKSKPCACTEAVNKEYVGKYGFSAFDQTTGVTEENIACNRCFSFGTPACVDNRCGLVFQGNSADTSSWKTYYEKQSNLKFLHPPNWKVVSNSKSVRLWPDYPESTFWFMDVMVANEKGDKLLIFRDGEPEMGSPITATRADLFIWLPDRKIARGVLGLSNHLYYQRVLNECDKITIGNNVIKNGDQGWYCLDDSWDNKYYVYVTYNGLLDIDTQAILDTIVMSHSR